MKSWMAGLLLLWASVAVAGGPIGKQPSVPLPVRSSDSMAAGRTGDDTAYRMTMDQVNGYVRANDNGTPVKTSDIIAKGPWVDVRHPSYAGGAKADNNPASAAQNRAALVAAICAAQGLVASGNKVVRLPGGVIQVDNSSGPITIPFGVYLEGTGSYWNGGTIIHFTDPTHDGFILGTNGSNVGSNGLRRLMIENANTGFSATDSGNITVDDVLVQLCTNGYILTDVNNSRFSQVRAKLNTNGAVHTYNGARTTDQSVFDRCEWNMNTSSGLTVHRGQGNTYISPQFVGNVGVGLTIDDGLSSTVDANFMLASGHAGGSNVMVAPYFEDVYGGTNTAQLLSLNNAWDWRFENTIFYNYYAKTLGVATLTRSARNSITGQFIDFAASPITTVATVDRTSWENTLDIGGTSKHGIADEGINTKTGTFSPVSMAFDVEAATIAHPFFDTIWSASGSTGDLSQDTADLFFPKAIAAQSLKITKGSTAASVTFSATTRALTAGGTYYLVITYKCDTAATAFNSPLQVTMQNTADSYKAYNFSTGEWDNSGSKLLALPLSDKIYTVSIPFKAPASSSAVYIYFTSGVFTGAGGSNSAVYHIYRANVQTTPDQPFALVPNMITIPTTPCKKITAPDADYTFGTNGESVLVSASTATRTVTVAAPTSGNQEILFINQSAYKQTLVVTPGASASTYYMRANNRTNNGTAVTLTVLPGASKYFKSTDGGDWVEYGAEHSSLVYNWTSGTSYTVSGPEKKILFNNNSADGTLYLPNGTASQMGNQITVANITTDHNCTINFSTSNVYTKSGTTLTYNAQPQTLVVGPLSARTFWADGGGNYIEQ